MIDQGVGKHLLRVGALTGALALAACGNSAQQPSNRSTDFPESKYPSKVFGDLSGTLHYYDVSGGMTTKVTSATIFKDFTDLTGVQVAADYQGSSDKLYAAEEAGNVNWDVAEFGTLGDFLLAKEKGMLQKLDPDVVPLNQLKPGQYDDYGIHSGTFGIVLGWNTNRWPLSGKHPTSMTDLLDTKTFPGKRCMYKYPEFGATLEAPLMADGVEPQELYPLDVDRALRKLQEIKGDIVWWSNGDQAAQYLTDGTCDIGVVWSGRAMSAVMQDDAPIAISWNKALIDTAAWGVPKGAPHPELGQALIAMAVLDVEADIKATNQIGYPQHDLPLSRFSKKSRPWIPAGKNLEHAVVEDASYYKMNLPKLNDRFTTWLAR